MKNLLLSLLISFAYTSCSTPEAPPEAPERKTPIVISFTDKTLSPPQESAASKSKKDSLLNIAQQNFNTGPNDLDNIIWLGRRTAYLWRYQEAIDIFTEGLKEHPDSPELYRHRGHRYISTRRLEKAITDFEKATELARNRPLEIEPDGLPNKLNQPLGNLHFNIYYHLGLAYYLKGDFAKAEIAYEKCMAWSDNPDLKVATADWWYMTLRRMDKTGKADSILTSIPTDWELIENEGYYNRILMYKGLKQPEELLDFSEKTLDNQLNLVTQGYGVGNWYLCNGDTTRANTIFNKIMETDYWSAFGYIAAEAELARK